MKLKLSHFLYLFILLTSCFKQEKPVEIHSAALREKPEIINQDKTPAPVKVLLLNKEQREAIYFSASLEKETLKLITKNPNVDDRSLFSVLSYALETLAGVKKSAPHGIDCSRYRFSEDSADKKIISVHKTCQIPEVLIAKIQKGIDPNHLTVTFFIKEWSSVVGLSVSVTGNDVVCDLQIKEKKLSEMSCLNWTKNLVASDTSSEDLKFKTFQFKRNEANQLVVKGGLYKDLVERRKIEMHVPLEGKIRLMEKEIEVIDEFADIINPQVKTEPTPKSSEQNQIQKMGELIEKNSQQKNETEVESNESQNNQNGESSQAGEKENREKDELEKNNSQIPKGRQNEQNGGIPPASR